MGDPLERVNKGEGVGQVFNADRFNLYSDATREYLRRKGGRVGAPKLADDPFVSKALVWVQNEESPETDPDAGVIPIWSVLSTTEAVIDPDAVPLKAIDHPVFRTVEPLDDSSPVIITIEPIAAGKLGRAVIAGVAVVEVEMVDESHRWARPIPGDSTKLRSAESGPIYLLAPPVGTVITCKQLVLLGGGGGGGSVVELIQIDEYPNGDGLQPAHTVQWDGSGWVEVVACFFLEPNGATVPPGYRLLGLHSAESVTTDPLPVFAGDYRSGVFHTFRYVCVAGTLQESIYTINLGPTGAEVVEDATCDFTFETDGLAVTFIGGTAAGVIIPAGPEPITYSWDFGDGNFGAGQSTSHTYAGAGVYEVVLTVFFGDGVTVSSPHRFVTVS